MPDATTEADSSPDADSAVVEPTEADLGPFEPSRIHDISVEVDAEDYDDAIAAYRDSAKKKWMRATVTIDGETYDEVGLRLKGNSSLFGLGATFGPEQSGDAPPGGFPEFATAEDPERLPWLIRLDKYVDDQHHLGYADIVVRSNDSVTALNESLSLELLAEAGLASQRAASTFFSFNGQGPALRLIIEHPDDVWAQRQWSDPSALYKAESGGDYSYRGEDPDAYTDVFDQEAGKDHADLEPLIAFLAFINDSEDETFNRELPERFDTDAFATYLAMQDVLQNFDDIDGPGNNSYLRLDVETGQFSVVPWDMNLALMAFPAGPGPGGPGAGVLPLPPGCEPPDLPEAPDPQSPIEIPEECLPPGFEPGVGEQVFEITPDGPRPVDPDDLPEGFEDGFPGGANVLVDRYLANPEWADLVEQRTSELRAELLATGRAEALLDAKVEVLAGAGADLLSPDVLGAEAEALRALINS